MSTQKLVKQSAKLLLLCALAGTGLSHAQDRTQDRDRLQEQDQDRIYGSQLMTQQEREQYRLQMRNLKTVQEREAYRLEHHKLMQERARQRGIVLPDEPPAVPGRMGGPGPGAGMGPGGGKGNN